MRVIEWMRDGRTEGQTDGRSETYIPTTTSLCRGLIRHVTLLVINGITYFISIYFIVFKSSHCNSHENNIAGLTQNCSNSIANALELLQSCAKPEVWERKISYSVGTQHYLNCHASIAITSWKRISQPQYEAVMLTH